MTIFYWAVAHLLYSDNGDTIDSDFYWANDIASIVFIAIYGAYAIIRFYFRPIGGLYMFKRLLFAAILVGRCTGEEAMWP